MNGVVQIRSFKKEDEAFIFATWLRHLWYSKDNKTTLSKETFMRLHHSRISDLLNSRPVEVACLAEDPDVIVGYAVHDDNRFTYLKKAWRGLGVEKLFKETP